jgi:hypothetical protein
MLTTGDLPEPREGHVSKIISNDSMIIQGGNINQNNLQD